MWLHSTTACMVCMQCYALSCTGGDSKCLALQKVGNSIPVLAQQSMYMDCTCAGLFLMLTTWCAQPVSLRSCICGCHCNTLYVLLYWPRLDQHTVCCVRGTCTLLHSKAAVEVLGVQHLVGNYSEALVCSLHYILRQPEAKIGPAHMNITQWQQVDAHILMHPGGMAMH